MVVVVVVVEHFTASLKEPCNAFDDRLLLLLLLLLLQKPSGIAMPRLLPPRRCRKT